MFSFPVAHFNKHVIRFGEKFIYALFCLQLAHATAIKGNDDKGMSLCQVATAYLHTNRHAVLIKDCSVCITN